jgi:uncharacterized protein involved in exopolysaccharide biosynthesis
MSNEHKRPCGLANNSSEDFSMSRQLTSLALFVVMTGLLLYGLLSLLRPQYEARVHLRLEGGAGENVSLRREMAILRSDDMALSFISSRKLNDNPDFNPLLREISPLERVMRMLGLAPDFAAMSARRRAIKVFNRNLRLRVSDDGSGFSLAFRVSDADEAAVLSNAYAARYAALYKNERGAAGRSALAAGDESGERHLAMAAIKARIDELARLQKMRKREMANIGQQIASLAAQQAARASAGSHEAGNKGSHEDERRSRAADLERRLILASAQRQSINDDIAMARNILERASELNLVGKVENGRHIDSLLRSHAAMQARMAKIEATLLPSHPTRKRTSRELAELEEQISAEGEKAAIALEAKAAALKEREKELRDELEQARKQIGSPAASSSEISRAVMAASEARARLSLLESEKREAERRMAGLRNELVAMEAAAAQAKAALREQTREQTGPAARAGVRVVIARQAQKPLEPVFPQKRAIALLGMLAALMLGMISILARAFLNHDPYAGEAAAGEEMASAPTPEPELGQAQMASSQPRHANM